MSTQAPTEAPKTQACLIASEYNSSQFSWHSDTKTFSQEASQLGWQPGSYARHIRITSAKTGDKRLFSLIRGGDEGWIYHSRELPGVLLKVWND